MSRQTLEVLARDPLVQALLAVLFLALAAIASLPAARGAGAIGSLPLWLLALPATALFAALAVRWPGTPAPARDAAAGARRGRPVAAMRRPLRAPRRARLPRAA